MSAILDKILREEKESPILQRILEEDSLVGVDLGFQPAVQATTLAEQTLPQKEGWEVTALNTLLGIGKGIYGVGKGAYEEAPPIGSREAMLPTSEYNRALLSGMLGGALPSPRWAKKDWPERVTVAPGAEKKFPMTAQAGSFIGMAVPIGGIATAARFVPLVGKLPKIAQLGVRGAMMGGLIDAYERGEFSPKDMATSAGIWAGLEVGGFVVGTTALAIYGRIKARGSTIQGLMKQGKVAEAADLFERTLEEFPEAIDVAVGKPVPGERALKPITARVETKKNEYVKRGGKWYQQVYDAQTAEVAGEVPVMTPTRIRYLDRKSIEQRPKGVVAGEEALRVQREMKKRLKGEAGAVDFSGAIESIQDLAGVSPEAIAERLTKEQIFDIGSHITDKVRASQYISHAQTKQLRNIIPEEQGMDFIHHYQNPTSKEFGKNLTDFQKGQKTAVKGFFDAFHRATKKAKIKIGYRENYIPGVWLTDAQGQVLRPAGRPRKLQKTVPFTKQKKFATIKDGIDAGYKPALSHVSEYMDYYADRMARYIGTKKFLDGNKKLIVEDGRKLVQRADKAPADYRYVNAPQFSTWKGIYVKDDLMGLIDIPYKVHPKYASLIEGYVAGFPINKTLGQVNAILKKVLLSASLFHWHALSESAVAVGHSPFKYIKGLEWFREGNPTLKMGIEEGLMIGPTEEMGYGIFQKILQGTTGRLRRAPLKVGRAVEQTWDKFLWDYYHTGHKTYAFLQTYEKLMKQPKWAVKGERFVAREAGEFVNNAFGGLNWERLMLTPQTRGFLRFMLLAPDWTISNFRIAYGGLPTWQQRLIESATKKVPGFRGFAGLAKPTAIKSIYRKYWARAMTFEMLFNQMANYALAGHFTWDNPEGHKAHIQLGPNQYIKVGKQFREPMELMIDPYAFVRRKSGILPRTLVMFVTGETVYGRRLYEKQKHIVPQLPAAIARAGKEYIPIPLQAALKGVTGEYEPLSALITALGFPVYEDRKRGGYRLPRLEKPPLRM